MHYYIRVQFLVLLLLFFSLFARSADTVQLPVRIAVLAPLNLDSAFEGYEYKLSNTKIPQYFLSGLEFYNGVMLAIDSLQNENANIEVWVYDTHKANQSTQQLTNEMQPMHFSLIVASISNASEQKIISEFSAKNSIPVISATFPNDINLENNPFFLMINPTWKTHVEAIYNYLAKNYKGKKISLFTRKGVLEERISDELQKLNAKHSVNFSTTILNDDFTDEEVLSHLDSTVQNIILCGSLNENFGRALIKTLNDYGEIYSTVAIGMPTWNGMSGSMGSSSDKIQIVITTPYNYSGGNITLQSIANNYKSKYFARPGDMVFKGYETMYHFTKLLLAYPGAIINMASATSDKIASDFNFKAIRLLPTSFIPDYLENKKIYYIKLVSGQVQSID
jgi:ABC-type branched-subunit amino acid transport system substrate-binding protein